MSSDGPGAADYEDADLKRFRSEGSPEKKGWAGLSASPLFYPKGVPSGAGAGAGAGAGVDTPPVSPLKNARLPVVVPPEEMDNIHKEFFAQISFLFQIMRRVENRGFMFRLDFNNYLCGLAAKASRPPK